MYATLNEIISFSVDLLFKQISCHKDFCNSSEVNIGNLLHLTIYFLKSVLFVNERLDPVYTLFSFHKNHMNIFEPRDSYKISVLSSGKIIDDPKYSGPGFGINAMKEG